MIKVLFMIPNLGHGGAEKVLVNLVNNMDKQKFDITVMTLYDEGVHKDSLAAEVSYKTCFKRSFPGVAHVLKLFSPHFLYDWFIHDYYDIVVSYLEGQTARIISGCQSINTKKVCWIHRTMSTLKDSARLFRNENEEIKCYEAFDKIVFVSRDVQDAFMKLHHLEDKGTVIYNTNLTDLIIKMSNERISSEIFNESEFKICAMGTLFPIKGFNRLLKVHKELVQKNYKVHTYILGEGPEKKQLQKLAKQYGVEKTFTLLGYQKNPYVYMKKCDLFVCSSFSEGFSTAVTEALILGLPVVTTRVSGMTELLGDNQKYGIIVDNDECALLEGIEKIIKDPRLVEYYQKQAKTRGKEFLKEKTVGSVQNLFEKLGGKI